MPIFGLPFSLVIKDLVHEAKAKTFLKAKDIKIFQGQHQGQLRQLSLRAKIYIAVTKTDYARQSMPI